MLEQASLTLQRYDTTDPSPREVQAQAGPQALGDLAHTLAEAGEKARNARQKGGGVFSMLQRPEIWSFGGRKVRFYWHMPLLTVQ